MLRNVGSGGGIVSLQREQEATEVKSLTAATQRLKVYIEQLNEHIVKIVESESDEFLTVASQLENFKITLTDL